jgi:hypothetical protein
MLWTASSVPPYSKNRINPVTRNECGEQTGQIAVNCAAPNHPIRSQSAQSHRRNLVLSAVIKLGCPRRFMVGDLLRHFQLASVLQIRRDTGRAEGMIANPRLDAGRFRAPADDAVGVLLEEGIGCQLAGLAASGAEEIAVDVIGDPAASI